MMADNRKIIFNFFIEVNPWHIIINGGVTTFVLSSESGIEVTGSSRGGFVITGASLYLVNITSCQLRIT